MIIKKNKKELKNMRLFFRVSLENINKLNIVRKHIYKKYELVKEYQDNYHKYFNKRVTREEIFKQAVFINNIRSIQKIPIKSTKQTTFGGLTQ